MTTLALVDFHCHVTDKSIESSQTLIDALATQGVSGIGIGGFDPEEWGRQFDLSAPDSFLLKRSIGYHPWVIHSQRPEPNVIRTTLESHILKVDAVGESGLDAFGKYASSLEAQEEALRIHCDIARQYKKPLILHNVRSSHHLQRLLKEKVFPPKVMLHDFYGGLETAKVFLDAGWVLSVNPTRRRSNQLETVIRDVPDNQLGIETDGPGTSQSPVLEMVEALTQSMELASSWRNCRPTELATTLVSTFRKFFN